MQKQYIIVMGNPVEGLKFFGPMTYEQAFDFSETASDVSADYWIAELIQPQYYKSGE